MDNRVKQRISYALKCKPSEVPEEPLALEKALKERRAKLKKEKEAKPKKVQETKLRKVKEAKHG